MNPYTDFGFKKLFGTEMNKELLISFLNSLLPDRQEIVDVTYLNTEHLGTLERDRRAVFDVYCENRQGEKFLVEMQKGEQQFFKDRSLFYTTFPVREQVTRGKEWDYELKAVYTIGILNFTFDEQNDEYYHHEVKLLDTRTKEVFYDKLTFIYLEMPKFNKTEEELENMFDKWLFVLRNLSRLMERPVALQERVFTKLFEATEIARFNRQELVEYEDSLKNFRDWYSVMKTAINKGRKEGHQEGLAEGLAKGLAEGLERGLVEGVEKGRKEEGLNMARRMRADGLSLEVIARYTGLTVEELSAL